MMKFQVAGMRCGGCARKLAQAIRADEADALVEVDLSAGTVDVQSRRSRAAVAESIARAGFRLRQG